MSSEAQPISAARFAEAIQDLEAENLYGKAYEINLSISKMKESNVLLQEYSDSIKNDTSLPENTRKDGDKDCIEAIQENLVTIERQEERVRLIKQEVERRGMRWHEAEPASAQNEGESTQTLSNGNSTSMNTSTASAPESGMNGRLNDEQLRQQLEARLDQEDDDGMHL